LVLGSLPFNNIITEYYDLIRQIRTCMKRKIYLHLIIGLVLVFFKKIRLALVKNIFLSCLLKQKKIILSMALQFHSVSNISWPRMPLSCKKFSFHATVDLSNKN
jgi:hypothetical protein